MAEDVRDQLKAAKQLVVENNKALKALKEGTREYKRQEKILNKAKESVTSISELEDKRKGVQKQQNDAQDKAYARNLKLRGLTQNLTKQAMRQADANQAISALSTNIQTNMDKAASFQANMSADGQILEDVYGMTSNKLEEVGNHFEDFAGMQSEAFDLATELAEKYDDIGTDGFDLSAMESSLEALGKKANAKREVLMSMIKTVKDPAIVKNLKDELKATEDTIEALKGKTSNLSRVDSLTKSATKELVTPFENMKGALEALPLGGFISDYMNLDGVVGDFAENSRKSIAAAFDPNNPMGFKMALGNVMKAGEKAATAIGEGFGKVNAMLGGMLGPIMLVVGAVLLAKKAMELFFGGTMDTRKELGVTTMEAAKLQNITNTAAMQFKMLGVSAEDVAGITKGIQENLGGVSQVTQETVTALASLNANFGVSGETASKLMATMQAVGSASGEAAVSQLESVGHLARQNGVAPAAIIEDMASDMDTFASFAVDGGKNLAKAAISARKLGLDMATTAKMAESLLNFEDSINAQMEASMLTGRMINTDKARELALAGDLDGMQREITSQIGSAAEFESMNVIQRQKLAAAFGVSVGELSKMITNQDKLNNMTDSEKKKRDLIAGAMEQLGRAGTQFLSALKSMIPLLLGILSPIIALVAVVSTVLILFGKVLEFLNKLNVAGIGLGDVLMAAAGAALIFRSNLLGGGLMNGLKSMKDMIGGMVGKMKGFAGGGGGPMTKGGKPDMRFKANKGGAGGKGGSPFGFMENMDAKKLLAGAAAMLIISAALFVTAKALQEFAEVSFGDLGKAGLALLGLVGVLAAVGAIMMSGVGAVAIIAGAAAMLVIASSLLILGVAIQAIGKGFDILASGLTKIFPVMSQLVSIGTSIMALGAAFGVLAVGLGAFAVAAMALLPALPVLMVLGGMALGAGMLLGGGGGAEEENKVEMELKKQNEKLDTMISLLSEDGPIAMNTEKGAKAGEGFIKSVVMA